MPSNVPDVRVRLSAEGVQDVVNAFKKIQSEAERTAKQTKLAGESHAFLNKQLESMKELLPTLAVGAIITGFVELGKSGLELATNIGRLQQKTGLAGETLSTLSFAARYAEVDQEALGKGLIKFTKSMDDYDRGATKVRSAIANLFGGPDALKGLDMDQRLQKIIDKLSKMEPGAKRTGAAMALFGKSGADLLPLMDELGAEGFDALRKKAEKLGISFNEDAVQAAENLKHSMITLKTEGQGMATQFLMGLAPQLANAADAITDSTAEAGTNGFQKVGKYAGIIINGIVAAFLIVGKTIGFVLSEASLAWDHFGEYAKDTFMGITRAFLKHPWASMFGPVGQIYAVLKEAGNNRAPGDNQFLDRIKSFADDARKSISSLFAERPTVPRRKTGPAEPSQPEDDGKAAKAKLDLAQAEADARMKVETAQQKADEDAAKEAYDKGLMSLRDYYAKRLEIVNEQGQAEIDAAKEKLAALQKAPLAKGELPDERKAKIVEAQADVQVKELQVQQQRHALEAEEAKEMEALQQKALDMEKKIEAAQGDRFAAAKAEIDSEANALDILLRKQGVSADQRQNRVGAFKDAGYQQVDFQQLQHQASMAMDSLNAQQEKINQDVASGALFAFQGEQKKIDLEQSELPTLRQIADEMQRTAITPEQKQAARDFSAQLDQLAISSNKAALEMAQFKQNAEAALTNDLSNWLSSGIDQAQGFADAFRSLALSVVQSLRQIAAQMLATYMIQKLLGLVGQTLPGGSTPKVVAKARGGLVRGPGSGTSDSIPARLSDYEYVVRSSVVRRPGMLQHLNELNYGTPAIRHSRGSRFADGGLVDASTNVGNRDAFLNATLGLNEGLILQKLEASSEFHRVFVRTAQANKKAMNQALGR